MSKPIRASVYLLSVLIMSGGLASLLAKPAHAAPFGGCCIQGLPVGAPAGCPTGYTCKDDPAAELCGDEEPWDGICKPNPAE